MSYLYSSKNEIIDTDKFRYYKSGRFSDVYKYENLLLKMYKDDITYRYYIPKRIFKLIKESNVVNVVKLLDYYHQFRGPIERILPIDAYTMEYVSDEKVSLIDMNIDYIKDITKKLEDTLDELSRKRILIEDTHEGNILFTKNNVTILDPDQFTHNPILTKKYIYQMNKGQLIKAINDTMFSELYHNNYRGFYKYITPCYGTSLTTDIDNYLDKEDITDSIKKKVLKNKEKSI